MLRLLTTEEKKVTDSENNIYPLPFRVSPEKMQMQEINVQKNSSTRFSFPSLPAHIVSPEEPVDVRVSMCVCVCVCGLKTGRKRLLITVYISILRSASGNFQFHILKSFLLVVVAMHSFL